MNQFVWPKARWVWSVESSQILWKGPMLAFLSERALKFFARGAGWGEGGQYIYVYCGGWGQSRSERPPPSPSISLRGHEATLTEGPIPRPDPLGGGRRSKLYQWRPLLSPPEKNLRGSPANSLQILCKFFYGGERGRNDPSPSPLLLFTHLAPCCQTNWFI